VEFAFLLVLLAAAVWAVILVQLHDVVTGTAIFLVATSLLPPEYASIEIGVSLTADRLWLVVLLIQFCYDLATGRSQWRAWNGADLFLMLFMGWLILRTIVTPMGEEIRGQPSTWMHLVNGYLVPAFLYGILRNTKTSEQAVWGGVTVMLLFGLYLSVTAILEVTKQWSLVFPPFIADPTLGIHFGRARGPMLNSVRLGMCLCACLAILWTFPVWLLAKHRAAWVLALVLTPLFLIGILLTYTRSVWMAAIAVVVILVVNLLRGKTRAIALGTMLMAGILGGWVAGQNLVAFKREYSAAETLESTRMRGAFAYVSWKMFQDRPLMGFGFNQFQVHNRPYLDDRTTDIRLESIRGYVHHNSYLSLLVDLGLLGGILFCLTSAAMLQNIRTLLRHRQASPLARSVGVMSLCVVVGHAIQMAFHEVSFSSIENTLLLFSLGLTQSFRDNLTAPASTTVSASLYPNTYSKANDPCTISCFSGTPKAIGPMDP